MLEFVLDGIESIVKKVENTGFQQFFFFPKYFQKPVSWQSVKLGIVW